MLGVGCYYCLYSLINNDGDVMKRKDQKDKTNVENESSDNESDKVEKQNEPKSSIQQGASVEEFRVPGDAFDKEFTSKGEGSTFFEICWSIPFNRALYSGFPKPAW